MEAHKLKSIVTGSDADAPLAIWPNSMGSAALTADVQAAPATWANVMDEIVTPVAPDCAFATFTVQTLALSGPALDVMLAVSRGLPGRAVFVRANVAAVDTPATDAVT